MQIQSLIIRFPFYRKVAKRKEKEVAEQYHQKMRMMLINVRVRLASSSTFPSEMLRKLTSIMAARARVNIKCNVNFIKK